MSEWIDSAASSAVWPCRSVHERASVSPTVKNVMSPSASFSRSDDVVERGRARAELRGLLVRELGELHLERAVDPAGAVLERDERLRRQRLELGGKLARPLGQRLAVVEVREQPLRQLDLLALGAIARLRLLAHPLEPSLDVLAVGDDQLQPQRLEVGGGIGARPRSRRGRRAARPPGGARRGSPPSRERRRPGSPPA